MRFACIGMHVALISKNITIPDVPDDARDRLAALIDSGPDGQWTEQCLVDATLCGPQILSMDASNILRRAKLAGLINPTSSGQAHQALCELPIALFE